MNKQQTAVDWLIEQYNLYRPGQMPHIKFSEVCEQAKEMEKKQIIGAVDAWVVNGNLKGEQYYNETYE